MTGAGADLEPVAGALAPAAGVLVSVAGVFALAAALVVLGVLGVAAGFSTLSFAFSEVSALKLFWDVRLHLIEVTIAFCLFEFHLISLSLRTRLLQITIEGS